MELNLFRQSKNAVQFNQALIGQGDFIVIAGPCSVEGEAPFARISATLKELGAFALRGGIFKLRTNPNDFQGLGESALSYVKDIKTQIGLPFITEVTDPRQIETLEPYVDCFQVGSRNMHNYALLKELGQTDKPILLKRGLAGLLKEWLYAAEYLIKYGNEQVVLCERGIRTFETATRNTFDINAIAYIKEHTPFPIIADPSHGTGERSLVTPVALAAAAAGADGLIVEVHHSPKDALSDGKQALTEADFAHLMLKLQKVLHAFDRQLLTNFGYQSKQTPLPQQQRDL